MAVAGWASAVVPLSSSLAAETVSSSLRYHAMLNSKPALHPLTGCVRLWDPRVQEPQVSLEPESGKARDCWTVAFGNSFSDDERCIAAGYDNGDVKLFDLRMNKLRWEDNVGNGVVGLQFDRKDIDMNKLLVTTLESKFRLYDMRTQHPSEGFAHLSQKAHKSTVWLGRHLPQNRDVFCTTGGNGGVNLYK